MRYLIMLLLITGCASPQLFPKSADLQQSCHTIVSSAYKTEAARLRASNVSMGIDTVGVLGSLGAALATGPAALVVGPVIILANQSSDITGAKAKSRAVQTYIEAGNRKECVDEDKSNPLTAVYSPSTE